MGKGELEAVDRVSLPSQGSYVGRRPNSTSANNAHAESTARDALNSAEAEVAIQPLGMPVWAFVGESGYCLSREWGEASGEWRRCASGIADRMHGGRRLCGAGRRGGFRVAAHPGDGDDVDGAVELAVAEAVEPVAVGPAGGRRDWCGAGQHAEAAWLWIVRRVTRTAGSGRRAGRRGLVRRRPGRG